MQHIDATKKVVVISGANGYLGLALVERLIADGFIVAGLDRAVKSKDAAGCNIYPCDITDATAVEKALETIERELGPIYACVHAAGLAPDRKLLHTSSSEQVKEQFEVNALGGFNFITACMKYQKEHGLGVVVGITTSALASIGAMRGLGAYVPAKMALQNMLALFKQEVAQYNIRVYAVAPGFMAGGMNKHIPQAFVDIIKEKSPTKKLTERTDVAGVVSTLCSGEGEVPSDFPIYVI